MSEADDLTGPHEDTVETTAATTAPGMERIAAAVVLAFGLWMLMAARGIQVRNETGGIDPRWWPTAIATGVIVCGLWMLINALLGVKIDRDVEASQRVGWIQMFTTLAGIAVVLFAWNLGISFVVLGPLFLLCLNWIYGLRKWTSLLLFPAIIGVLLYSVFQLLLKVPL